MSAPPTSSPAPIPQPAVTLASAGMRDAAEDSSDSPPSRMSEDDDDDGSPGGGGAGGGDRWAPDLRGSSNGGRWAPPDQVLENVLESVLEFLTAARDRNAASLVCRSWYRAEAQTRRELFIGNCYAVSPGRAVQRFRGVTAVVLKGKPRFADFSLLPDGWGANVKPWVEALGPAYPCLERICLKRMTVTDDDLGLVARSFPQFKELSLVCCEGFGTLGLAVIAERCRHLRVLDLIEDYVDQEDEAVDWISKFPVSNTSLESLMFDCVGVPFNFEALEALVARSPSLHRLRVNHHVSVEQLRRLMARAPQLTHLGTGAFRPEAAQGGGMSVSELAPSFAAASTSIVCLSGFQEVNPEYLSAIYPVCGNLTSLNVSFASLTAEDLTPVIRQCHKLQTFWVLDTVGDEGLRAVAETCSDLRELRVFPLDATED